MRKQPPRCRVTGPGARFRWRSWGPNQAVRGLTLGLNYDVMPHKTKQDKKTTLEFSRRKQKYAVRQKVDSFPPWRSSLSWDGFLSKQGEMISECLLGASYYSCHLYDSPLAALTRAKGQPCCSHPSCLRRPENSHLPRAAEQGRGRSPMGSWFLPEYVPFILGCRLGGSSVLFTVAMAPMVAMIPLLWQFLLRHSWFEAQVAA